MATSGYSEDLQSQQANVTIATPAAAAPSSAKAAHFLSEIPPASTSIAASNPSAVSKAAGQAAANQNQNQNQKAVALTSASQHYVTSDIQQSAAQKTNGQSSSPQYIIVTVTGERSVSGLRLYTHTLTAESVCFQSFRPYVTISICYSRPCMFRLLRSETYKWASLCLFLGHLFVELFGPLVSSHTCTLTQKVLRSCGNQMDVVDSLTE